MNLLRSRFERMFSNYEGEAFWVGYWDGGEALFGEGVPDCKIQFHTREAFARTILNSSLGFGEAYAEGTISVEGDLEDAVVRLCKAYASIERYRWLASLLERRWARSLFQQRRHIEHHYGLGNDFYKFYLDRTLQYSCAYFRSEDDSLDDAQEQKLEHTCRKLRLEEGQHLLDIGCGWGHLMFHAAENWGVSCLGITLCENQAAYIREQALKRGLPIEVRVMNYLELDERQKWDRIVSVGMMCHIGEKHMNAFYDKVHALQAPGAINVLHCIAKMKESSGSDAFLQKYIFPGYWFNSMEGLTKRSVERGWNVIDVENLRRHYWLTCRRWRENFLENYDEIKKTMGFDDRFMRIWEFYLVTGAAGFRTGHLNLLQIVSSNGIQDSYPWTREFLYRDSADSSEITNGLPFLQKDLQSPKQEPTGVDVW